MTEIIKPTELESASVSQRVVAFFIDVAVIAGVVFVPTLVNPEGALFPVLALLAVVAMFVYRLLGDALFGGAALGKRLVGIRVVDAETRRPCSRMQCLMRSGIFMIPFAPVIEFIILSSDRQQRWGDQVARTYVLRVHPKTAPLVEPSHPIDFAGLKETVSHLHPHAHADEEGQGRREEG